MINIDCLGLYKSFINRIFYDNLINEFFINTCKCTMRPFIPAVEQANKIASNSFSFTFLGSITNWELLPHANSGSFWQVSCTLCALLFSTLSGLYMLAADSTGILLLMLLSNAQLCCDCQTSFVCY